MCVCGGGGGGLISGSLCYSRAGHGCNLECTPNMDSNEIVWNNVDCIDIGTNICHHLDLLYCYLIPLL